MLGTGVFPLTDYPIKSLNFSQFSMGNFVPNNSVCHQVVSFKKIKFYVSDSLPHAKRIGELQL